MGEINLPYETVRVLIWGKTYPELSKKHVETVCTGGVREDGSPIRLYPVPLRYLDGARKYRLYDWIDVPVQKSKSDPRPESYKVHSERIRVVGHLDTTDHWRARKEVVFRDPSWHFESVSDLKQSQRHTGRSIGMIVPSTIDRVHLEMKPRAEANEYSKRIAILQAQTELFHPQYKELEYLPFRIKLAWRCLGVCSDCRKAPHDMTVLDWGLLELARRDGAEVAIERLRHVTEGSLHDFRIFMGNFRLHLGVFGVIGLWYPRITQQLELL